MFKKKSEVKAKIRLMNNFLDTIFKFASSSKEAHLAHHTVCDAGQKAWVTF